MLLRERKLPNRCGLIVRDDAEFNMAAYASLKVAQDADGEVIGCRWIFAGLPLALAMLSIAQDYPGFYRPKSIEFQRDEGTFTVLFDYPAPFVAWEEIVAPHRGAEPGMHPEWERFATEPPAPS